MSHKVAKQLRKVSESMVDQQRTIAMQSTQYSGPIPPAEEFQKYELVLSGAADRILSMAENQAAHRMGLEKSVIASNQLMQILGWISSSAITLSSIG